jgi:hypothetical protein
MPEVIDCCILAGGDFVPPAGEVVRRAASYLLGGEPAGKDPDEWYRFKKKVAYTVTHYAVAGESVDPIRQIAPAMRQYALREGK